MSKNQQVKAFLTINKHKITVSFLAYVADEYNLVKTNSWSYNIQQMADDEANNKVIWKQIKMDLRRINHSIKTDLTNITVGIDDALFDRRGGTRLLLINQSLHYNYNAAQQLTKLMEHSATDYQPFFIQPLSFEIDQQMYQDLPLNQRLGSVNCNYIESIIKTNMYHHIFKLCDYLGVQLDLILPISIAQQTCISKLFTNFSDYINVDWNNKGITLYYVHNHNFINSVQFDYGLDWIFNQIQTQTSLDLSVIHTVIKGESFTQPLVSPQNPNYHYAHGDVLPVNDQVTASDRDQVLSLFDHYFMETMQVVAIKIATIVQDTNVKLLFSGDVSKVFHLTELITRNTIYQCHVVRRVNYDNQLREASLSLQGMAYFQHNQNLLKHQYQINPRQQHPQIKYSTKTKLFISVPNPKLVVWAKERLVNGAPPLGELAPPTLNFKK